MNVSPSDARTYSMYALGVFGLLMLPVAVALFVFAATTGGWMLALFGLITLVIGVGATGTAYNELNHASLETNMEKEMLSKEQQRILRTKRGDVIFDQGLVDVEKKRMQVEAEREALLARQIEAPKPGDPVRLEPHHVEQRGF